MKADNFKWKTEIYNNGNYKIYPIPYCPIHDLKLVESGIGHFCPDINKGCKSQIETRNIQVKYDTARSYIEKMLNK